MYYDRELAAIERAGRLRKRKVFPYSLKDFASNDYLGLAHNKKLLERAYKRVRDFPINAAKASQLVNGYTDMHRSFEEYLCAQSGFEAAITAGSGFLANIAIIEALVRSGDRVLLDEEFHASGILAARLVGDVEFFRHNDAEDLKKKLQKRAKRTIVAVEGIYSMSGDLLNPEIFEVIQDEILVVDEAHSVGVVGERLLGVFDLYNRPIKPNYIKMGTLGKALGSYGAYILASREIVQFLENRAKSIIYTTALSLMDVALAQEGFKEIERNVEYYKTEIAKRKRITAKFGYSTDALIIDIPCKDPVRMQEELMQRGYLVGAMRPPTVKKPMLRVIARVGESAEDLEQLLGHIDVCV